MATASECIATWTNRCELLNCIFGFNGSEDPTLLGYGRDEIEVISSSGNSDFCTEILDRAVEAGIIPEYKPDDNGDPGGGEGGGEGDGGGSENGEEDDMSNFAQASPIIPIGVLAWLVTT